MRFHLYSLVSMKYSVYIIIAVCFIASFLFPGIAQSDMMNAMLAVIGILYGIVIGFFINDVWSRFSSIRENVGMEVSGWGTYYLFIKILATEKHHKKWAEKQRKLIGKYIKKFITVEWENYQDTEPEFNEVMDGLAEIENPKTNKETETWSNLLAVASAISDAREKLIMLGKDRLGRHEWVVVISLCVTLLGALFYLKTPDFTSSVFTALLASASIVLMIVLHDLSDLRFGEETVSFEPYEKVFDNLGMPRFYLKEHIEEGHVVPPEGVKYEVGER